MRLHGGEDFRQKKYLVNHALVSLMLCWLCYRPVGTKFILGGGLKQCANEGSKEWVSRVLKLRVTTNESHCNKF